MRLVGEIIPYEDCVTREIECCCCGSTPRGGLRKGMLESANWKVGDMKTVRYVCDLCSGTFASKAFDYYNQYTEQDRITLQAICFVGNTIRNDIESLLRRLKEKDA